MDATYWGLVVSAHASRARPSTASTSGDSYSLPSSTTHITNTIFIPSVIANKSSSAHTRRSGSTVWGPGALTGKFLKRVGQVAIEWGAEYWIIRKNLGDIQNFQPHLLNTKILSNEDRLKIKDHCNGLVDLSIPGTGYPSGLASRAFQLILRGFRFPARQIWSSQVAEAISQHETMDIFALFQEGFFTLLDDSIFRIDGIVGLETLTFRCPAVTREIANIITHLARKDRPIGTLSSPIPVLGSSTTMVEDEFRQPPAYSRAIIQAGFFRLVRYWTKHGLAHWDQRGIECLECALKEIVVAQEHQGDMGNAGEARELGRKLQARRLLLEDIEEAPEPSALS